MAFRWKRFAQWVLLALGLIVLGTFLLMGGSWNDYLFGMACTVERDFPT
jgi:hypothetical protein